MSVKEYRVPMPLTVEEFRIGQLYMIARHSHEQSGDGEGVEVVMNEPSEDPEHGKGQYTEKRIYLSSKLPTWVRSYTPHVFYITEKAWNFYPYTKTEYECSFLPRFSMTIETRYENNKGTTENIHGLTGEELKREVEQLDIVTGDLPERYYSEAEDLTKNKSKKTGRGPFAAGWMDEQSAIMCSYKLVRVKFDTWGLQARVEGFTQSAVKDVLMAGHRQAVAWLDDWIDMGMEDLRAYEREMNEKTNSKVRSGVDPASLEQTEGQAAQ